MIIKEDVRPFASTLPGVATQFKMKVDRKAFEILVSGIYSNRVESCVREIMSNGWDAQIRRGINDVGLVVTLPTELNGGVFAVRDHGEGMDDAFVMSTYTTLFESTKGDDNTQVGAFGLGKMTPLAYTDAFSLTCYDGKQARLYLISFGASGVPEILRVATESSSEHKGVEVSFTVNSGDFRRFHEAAKKVALGFDVAPKFLGATVETPKPLYTGKYGIHPQQTYACYDSTGYGNLVKQGCAVYPLPGRGYGHNNNLEFIINMPIGTVKVTSSRESIDADPTLIDTLQRNLSKAWEDVVRQVRAELDKITDPYDRAVAYYSNSGIVGQDRDYQDIITIKLPTDLKRGDDPRYATNHFRASEFSGIKLAFDDTTEANGGAKMLRKKLRLKAFSGAGRYRHGRAWYITEDKAYFDLLVQMFRLKPEQAFNLSSIPDVAVNNARTSNYTPPPKKVIDSRPWGIRVRNVHSSGALSTYFFDNSQTSTYIHNLCGNDILWLTELEAQRHLAKGTIDPDNTVEAKVKAALGKKVTAFTNSVRANRYPSHNAAGLMFETKAGIAKADKASEVEVELYRALFPKEAAKIEEAALTEYQEFSERYPLLFGRTNEQAVRDYIAMVDAQ